jgi:hypothetical protein
MRPTARVSNTRRSLLATVGAATLGGVAGCLGDSGDGGTVTPDDLPGLRLSMRADRGVTTDDKGRVESWIDQSEQDYEFTARGGESLPGLAENAAGGKPAITFDGDGQYFLREDTLGIADGRARTVVVVSRLTDTEARSPFFMQGRLDASGGGSNAYGLEANTFNTDGERFGVYLVSVANDAERATDTNYHVHTLRTRSFPVLEDIRETTTYYVDSTETAFSHTGGGAFNSPFQGTASAIGAFPERDAGTTLSGEIAAIRVYNRALSTDERTTVETTMADRYGIDLG